MVNVSLRMNESKGYTLSMSKHSFTTRHFLFCCFVIASFFNVLSNGMKWIQTPQAETHAEIGKNALIRWQYILLENETLLVSTIAFKSSREKPLTDLFKRVSDNPYVKAQGSTDLHAKSEVRGKQNVSLILKDVQESFDSHICLEVEVKVGGVFQENVNCTKFLSFAYPLVTFFPKKNVLANVTDQLTLYCNAAGKPEPKIIWKKADDLSNVLASSSWFNLSVTGPSVQGAYMCLANNSFGTDKKTFFVEVQYKPDIHTISTKLIKTKGSSVSLYCNASGHPNPTVSWAKKDNIAAALKSGQGSVMLQITNVSRADAGDYYCTAINILGSSSNGTSITVYYAPKIIHITAGKTVNESNLVSLKCNASGLPFPHVQWFKGNKSLGNVSVGHASETLTSVTWKDTGEYICKAVNLLGTEYNTTDITVQYKPINTKLTTNTGNHEIAVNETLVLSCSAQALPHTNWFTFSSKNRKLQSSGSSTYLIKKQTWSPTEEYTCIPENILGRGTPSGVNISFLEPPSFTNPPDRNQEVNESNTIKLECLVDGKPKPSVNWTKGGSGDVIDTDEVFIKNNTIHSDAGTYRCTASNGVGEAIEAVFTVVVNYKPINTRLISTNGREGVTINEPLNLNCSAQSVPAPHTFRLKVNETALNYTSSNGTFVVYKDRPFYDENYTCVATNLLGEGKESNTLIITMFEPAVIYNATGNVTVDENKPMTLECRAHGKPKPNVTWTKGNSTKVIGISQTYMKDRTEKCDAGVYKCSADNGVRKAVSSQAIVTVKSYPGPPKILDIAISIPRIEVHWEQPAANCSLPITGYLAQVREKESQGEWTECEAKREKTFWMCSFGELESSTTYTLQIFAKNRFGNGMPAEKDFETKEKESSSGSTDASKGGLSKKSYIIIGACTGGLFLLVIIVVVVKRLRTKHGESTLQTPIELRQPEDDQQKSTVKIELQNGLDGPMSASQETLDVKETEADIVEVEAKNNVEENKL